MRASMGLGGSDGDLIGQVGFSRLRLGTGDEPERESKLFCPKCGCYDIRPSHTVHILDAVVRCFSVLAFRCRWCRQRFYSRS